MINGMSDHGIFQGVNAAYVLELYDKYQRDPQSVDPATREFFETWTPPPSPGDEKAAPGFGGPGPDARPGLEKRAPEGLVLAVGAFNLAQSIRRYGHRLVPFVLIALGALILYEAGSFRLLRAAFAS